MTITTKPRKKEDLIKEVISKGGTPALGENETLEEDSSKKVFVQLRLEQKLIDRIDKIISKRTLKIPRHQWLLETILMRLKNEEQEEQGENKD